MQTLLIRLSLLVILIVGVGCGTDTHRVDEDGGPADAASTDADLSVDEGTDLAYDGAEPWDGALLNDGAVDDGGEPIDAGSEPTDAGELMVDAGPEVTDSGLEPTDAGSDSTDSGTVDGGLAPCATPGATEDVACGRCGTTVRFCSAEHTWQVGLCTGEAGCAPGMERATICGNCGVQSERCSATCAWETVSACSAEGECAPGTRTRTSSGCAPGELREVECSGACAFAPVGACESGSCATAGVLEHVACGTRCGTMPRFCTAANLWSYGTCAGEGLCEPGTTSSVPCGACGTQTSTCTAACAWDGGSACTGEGPCTPGDTSYAAEGCPPDASRLFTCGASCTFEPGACVPRECTTDTVETLACGRCGSLVRTCDAAGRWVSGACTGEGACMPGALGTRSCGICGSLPTLCTSTCDWTDAGTCGDELVCAPMLSSCVDGATLRTHLGTPVCSTGLCSYSSFDLVCGGTCSDRGCIGPIMLRTLGGTSGFGSAVLPPNDDSSSTAIALATAFPAGLRFYGATYTTAFVNNNGNVSLGAAAVAFSPVFPISGATFIAPWWGDVDTRGGGQPARNTVNWYIDGSRMVVTWHLVGFYATHDTLQNSFQVILTNRDDVALGDFDVEFRYEQCAWTTGDASMGTGGLGGTPAAAGFNAGNGTDGLALPGSGTAAILDLCTSSNVGLPGLWSYHVRGGIPSSAAP